MLSFDVTSRLTSTSNESLVTAAWLLFSVSMSTSTAALPLGALLPILPLPLVREASFLILSEQLITALLRLTY